MKNGPPTSMLIAIDKAEKRTPNTMNLTALLGEVVKRSNSTEMGAGRRFCLMLPPRIKIDVIPAIRSVLGGAAI